MSPESGGKTRQARKEPSHVTHKPLQDRRNAHAIHSLLQLVRSSTGPSGKQKLLHNGRGGHVTCTSTCSRLLQNMSISNPLLQLLVAPVLGQIRVCHDGGMTSLLLALLVVDAACKTDLRKHLLVEIYQELLERCNVYMNSENCRSKVSVTFDNTAQMLFIVNGVIGSKKGCCLTAQGNDVVSKLVVEGFLKTFSDKSPNCDNLFCIGVEGGSASESKLHEGILLETPQIPVYRKKPVLVKTYTEINGQRSIKVALFTVSLSGDVSSLPGAIYEVKKAGQVEEGVLQSLMSLAEKVVRDGVGLVLCQKVVHPNVKKYWKKQGLMVLDRLGSKYAGFLLKLSGCVAISSLDAGCVCASSYGQLSDVQHVVIEGKSYVHLTAEGSTVHTLLLRNFAEEPLQELMHVCRCAREILDLTLRTPQALQGGGCWQADLALHIHLQIHANAETLAADLGCSTQQLIEGGTILARGLVQVASTVDNGSGTLHAWMHTQGILTQFENMFPVEYIQCLPADETVVETKPVLDSFTVCSRAFATAITAVSMLLSVGVIIKDPN